MRIAIIGCARSGTKYISEVLNYLGLKIGHEYDNTNGIVDWHKTCSDLKHYDLILHQVRNPLNSIASITTLLPESWELIKKHIPEINEDDTLIVKCMKYWYYWNLLAEKHKAYFYNIESIETLLPSLCDMLKVQHKDISHIAKDLNKRNHVTLLWENLITEDEQLAIKIKELAAKYGF